VCYCSDYSDTVIFYTSGSVPATPDAPTLTEAFVHALTITWTRRANDDQFTLQMEDETTVRRLSLWQPSARGQWRRQFILQNYHRIWGWFRFKQITWV